MPEPMQLWHLRCHPAGRFSELGLVLLPRRWRDHMDLMIGQFGYSASTAPISERGAMFSGGTGPAMENSLDAVSAATLTPL